MLKQKRYGQQANIRQIYPTDIVSIREGEDERLIRWVMPAIMGQHSKSLSMLKQKRYEQ